MQLADSAREAHNDSIKRERKNRKRKTRQTTRKAASPGQPRKILDENIPSNTDSK